MESRVFVALLGLAVVSPLEAQIADRIDERMRAGRASGGVAYARGGIAACARYEWQGTHLWFDFGWVPVRPRDAYDAWYYDDGHRDWRVLERERDRCRDWSYARAAHLTRWERDHVYLHEDLAREHLEWHWKHDRRPRNRGWWRSHEALHDRLAREHDRWHRKALHDWDHDHRRPARGWATGSDR